MGTLSNAILFRFDVKSGDSRLTTGVSAETSTTWLPRARLQVRLQGCHLANLHNYRARLQVAKIPGRNRHRIATGLQQRSVEITLTIRGQVLFGTCALVVNRNGRAGNHRARSVFHRSRNGAPGSSTDRSPSSPQTRLQRLRTKLKACAKHVSLTTSGPPEIVLRRSPEIHSATRQVAPVPRQSLRSVPRGGYR